MPSGARRRQNPRFFPVHLGPYSGPAGPVRFFECPDHRSWQLLIFGGYFE
jgi:hypothetical protein